MKIAQIMLAKGFGGAERSFVDLSLALAQRGHEVLAIGEIRGAALAELDGVAGLQCHSVAVRGAWDFLARREIRRLLAGFQPDVAQAHLARAAKIAGSAARSLGIPTLAKTHNYVDLKYYRAIDHLVATTRRQQAYLLDRGVGPTRLSLIPNFTTEKPRSPDRDSTAKESTTGALAIGRMVHKKGFDVLLEALAIVRAAGADISLSLAGDGPESDTLHERRNDLKLDRAVRFLGWQDSIARSLQAADVFVLPSRDEPFGIVCLEAMAARVPIIATRTDGPSEVLDETCAILVAPDDPKALAAALEDVVRDRAGALERAARAYERFKSRYDEGVVVAQYLALYSRLTAL